VLVVAAATTGCSTSRRRTLYWPAGAIFSERGDWVYFVTRRTDVTEHGSSNFSITGHHPVNIWSDELTLQRVRLSDGVSELLIRWPSTPESGKENEAYSDFSFPATASMYWLEPTKLRIGISLNETLQTTETVWTEGLRNPLSSFNFDNPGYGSGRLNVCSVHDNLELIPLSDDERVSAYILYDWSKPEARIIAREPPGAKFRMVRNVNMPLSVAGIPLARDESVLRVAPILSRRAEFEHALQFGEKCIRSPAPEGVPQH
jgi:hypothetical protein